MSNLTTEKILPRHLGFDCPWCGYPARIEPWHGGKRTKVMIDCSNDDCPVSPQVTGETPAAAMKKWNSRAVCSALRSDDDVKAYAESLGLKIYEGRRRYDKQ